MRLVKVKLNRVFKQWSQIIHRREHQFKAQSCGFTMPLIDPFFVGNIQVKIASQLVGAGGSLQCP
jgi:hypothetical protein